MKKYDLVVIGGGAAGFFAAISAAELYPGKKIVIIEKTNKALSKVKVSGGGRCNVTHACFENYNLAKFYPRGGKFLKSAFKQFSVKEAIEWFESRGVRLKTEPDGRMFPVTDDSQTIVNCLMREISRLNIELVFLLSVEEMEVTKDGSFVIRNARGQTLISTAVVVAAGGFPKLESFSWFARLGIKIIPPVPSLFTFNVPDSEFKELSGISVPDAYVRIEGTKIENTGPLLITHWGFSGPAILKLSAWGARELNELNYEFNIQIRWQSDLTEQKVVAILAEAKQNHPKKMAAQHSVFNLPSRLWEKITRKANIYPSQRWVDLSKKQLNLLMENIVRAHFHVKGKTTFKEEFVTCGGVSLDEIDVNTMQSRKIHGLFFAGEVLNIDGVTGGFNFQNAWTTGYIAGKNALKKNI